MAYQVNSSTFKNSNNNKKKKNPWIPLVVIVILALLLLLLNYFMIDFINAIYNNQPVSQEQTTEAQ